MYFDEDKEEDDGIELAPPQCQVPVSEVCLFHSFFIYTNLNDVESRDYHLK
jgi:hypothetical protein